MSKRKGGKKSKPPDRPLESRAAEAVTVAWMLTTLATLVAEVGGVIGWLLLVSAADPQKLARSVAVLPGLILYIGLITGIIGLVLAPVAHRIRRVPPPTSVTVVAVVIALSPAVTIFVLAQLQ